MAVVQQHSKLSIGRKIRVKCRENVIKVGFLYTVDPLTDALVIVDRKVSCDKVDKGAKGPGTFYNSVGPEDLLEIDEQRSCEKVACMLWGIRLEIIMGDAYTEIEDIHGSNDSDDWNSIEKFLTQVLQPCNSINGTQLDPAELKLRMGSVAEFLKSHHLPLNIDNDLIVLFDGLVNIEPPYVSASCFSRNSIVLDKVRKLMEQFNSIETKQTGKND